MKFAAIRDLQNSTSTVVKKAQREPIIVTVHGRPKAVLTKITEDELEDFLFENSPILRRRIEEGLKDIKKGRTVSYSALKARLRKSSRRGR